MFVIPGIGSHGSHGSHAIQKYDEAEFLVGGRRGKRGEKGGPAGNLETVSCKIHEGYVAELDKWWRSKRFPYDSISDIVRHAIVRHLRYYLPSVEGEVEGTLLHELAQIDEHVARWRFQNEFVQHIDRIAEQVNLTLQMPGGKGEVVRMLRFFKKKIDATKPSFQKGVYQKMFNDRFGSYLKRNVLLEHGSSEESMAAVYEFPDIAIPDPPDYGQIGGED